MAAEGITIAPAVSAADLADIAGLFRRYAEWLEADFGISLAFQGFEQEVAALPGKYAAPRGVLLLARDAPGRALGCIGLRPFRGADAEVKRLYVLPAARGSGLGRTLALRIVAEARARGYARALLDTAGAMKAAQAIYAAAGFTDTAPYYDNPYADIRFMACDLRAP